MVCQSVNRLDSDSDFQTVHLSGSPLVVSERRSERNSDFHSERSKALRLECQWVTDLGSRSDLKSDSPLAESERQSVSAMERQSDFHLERSKVLRLECQWGTDSGSRSDLKSDHKWATNLDSRKEMHLGSHSGLK